jgi:outer membrane receptor protein involved in Fe transport
MLSARTPCLRAFAAGLWSAWALAGEAAAPMGEASEASATVTVTAEALPVPLVQTPNPVLVLGPAALARRGAGSLGELLMEALPGQVFASGGAGSVASIRLGGTRPQDTILTLDGLRLTDAAGTGGVNPNLITLAGIERVEVQTGPCSTRFGSDALGGAIALYSAGCPPPGVSGEFRAAAGSLGILRSSLGAAHGWDRGWIRMAVSAQREDQVLAPANRFRSTGTCLGLGRQVGADTLITFNYINNYAGVPVPVAFAGYGTAPRAPDRYDPDRQSLNRTQLLSGTVRSAFSPELALELSLGQVLQVRLEPGLAAGMPRLGFLSRRNQAVGGLTWQSAVAAVRLGLDGSEETAHSPALDGAGRFQASARRLAALLEGQRELRPGLRVVAALRTGQDRTTVPGCGSGALDSGGTRTTGKLGVNWTLPAGFRAYVSAGTGFSQPLLYSSVFNGRYGGPALDSERSRTAQAGLTCAAGPWTAGLELSRTLFANLVFFDPGAGAPMPQWGPGARTGLYRNGSRIRVQAMELRAGYATAAWGVHGFYRNQEARDLQAPEGRQLSSPAVARRPFQTVGLQGFRVLGQVRLEGRWSWTGSRYDPDLPPGQGFKAHYNDLGLSAAWTPRPDLTFTLRGERLLQPRTTVAQWLARSRDFQNDAAQVFGHPAQPPAVILELRYRF